jgi:hypothetical protein
VAESNFTSSGGSAKSGVPACRPSSPSGVFSRFHVLFRHFFEDGILLEFLLDERLEFERGGLQQRQRLLELRRQHQRLRQSLRKL